MSLAMLGHWEMHGSEFFPKDHARTHTHSRQICLCVNINVFNIGIFFSSENPVFLLTVLIAVMFILVGK